MEVSRLVLVVAAGFVLAFPAARAQDDDAVATQSGRAPGPPKPWKYVRGFGRVLDLSKPPVVIDEPGLYALQQDWRLPAATANAVPELIRITADDVTLDLHGFTISAEDSPSPPTTLLVIAGRRAEVRNGGIEAHGIDAAVHGTAGGPWLHHLSVSASENPDLRFEGNETRISDSDIVGSIQLAGGSNLERNMLLASRSDAVSLDGDGNRVIGNRIFLFLSDAGVRILGDANIVADNVMDVTEPSVLGGFVVEGDHNVLSSNIVLAGSNPSLSALWRINGTGNTLDGNIAPPNEPGAQVRTGIEFTADGNYYGNNRIAAMVPFALGGTVQTNWGGNVGY